MSSDGDITLVVTDWPYCGVGAYFCVALDRLYDNGVTGAAIPGTQPLVMSIPDAPKNRTAFAVGRVVVAGLREEED
jgi:hypothetical protein